MLKNCFCQTYRVFNLVRGYKTYCRVSLYLSSIKVSLVVNMYVTNGTALKMKF